MRPLKLHELLEEWLGRHPDLYHFYIWQAGSGNYHVTCACSNGWWLRVHDGFVDIGTDVCDLNNPPKLYAHDPEFFAKLEDLLTKGHLKWKGEFRGRPAQS